MGGGDLRLLRRCIRPQPPATSGRSEGIGAEGYRGMKRLENELIIEIRVGEYYQKLPYTEDGIKLAKGFLDLLKNQLKVKAKPEEKASKLND
jgi:hypothetical protein